MNKEIAADETGDEIVSPDAFAKEVGLRYVTDQAPGIKRIKGKEGSFTYVDSAGKTMHDEKVLQRITALRIPPAWENVWICPFANGHIQATGLDSKGRKQYRYHAKWQTARNTTKFSKMLGLGAVLPLLRQKLEKDIKKADFSREKILATVVSLLDNTHIRVGNSYYARTNQSYGLTTLRNKHVKEEGNEIKICFVGKKSISHEIVLSDKRLIRIVKKCKELPGYNLFQYFDEEGLKRPVNSEDVNDYLRENTGIGLTAKDFRTWGASVLAIEKLLEEPKPATEKEIQKKMAEAIKFVAKKLGNTAAVCRNYYVHPMILDGYVDGKLETINAQIPETNDNQWMQRKEEIFIKLLMEESQAAA